MKEFQGDMIRQVTEHGRSVPAVLQNGLVRIVIGGQQGLQG
jgi:hypothetical protein